jgi:hypothetical protein
MLMSYNIDHEKQLFVDSQFTFKKYTVRARD